MRFKTLDISCFPEDLEQILNNLSYEYYEYELKDILTLEKVSGYRRYQLVFEKNSIFHEKFL